ncbi:disintegrin and metalloproteinase domain-containing protein 10-like [Halichondria panicea]|uniref:disintegrin and metalloproteinase domain-containing protein 10-like n=1 Tax=Halichondria panicea TaxID=6063 RepID=UPI00312B6A07
MKMCSLPVSLWPVAIACLLVKLTQGDQNLDEFVRQYQTVTVVPNVVSTTSKSLTAEINFKAFERDFNIHLETHKTLFDPEFHVEIIGKTGRSVNRDTDTRGYVTGYVKGEVGSTVHGRVAVNAVDIVIKSQRETYHLEPSSKYGLHGNFNSVVYRTSDVVYELEHKYCTSTDFPMLRLVQESAKQQLHSDTLTSELKRKRAVDNDKNTCRIKIVADYEFYSNIGNLLESTTLSIMMDHIMASDKIYRRTKFIGTSGEEMSTEFGLSVASAQIYMDENPATNPLVGGFSTSELLESFASLEFDDVCLGHLFTYRDFQGVVGLAYLADPSGQLAGGICQTRTRTAKGDLNLNTGFTSLLNFGRRVPQAVSTITVAHELGHNHGSPHDPADNAECSPGGSAPKYIMFPSATDGGLEEFSICSRRSIGATLEARSSSCFVPEPSGSECGNGVVQSGEECDCGTKNETLCEAIDSCCTVNCTLAPGAICSAAASSCCDGTSCSALPAGTACRTGDIAQEGCQDDAVCNGTSPECPPTTPLPDGASCNNGENVCEDGSCIGSPCSLFNSSQPCFCMNEEELCDICCLFDGEGGECTSTLNREGVNYTQLLPGSPCANFSGYCTSEHNCLRINNDDPLNNLKNILEVGFTSIAKWLETYWYWIVVGLVGFIVLIVLVQVTYRRKKISSNITEENDTIATSNQRRGGRLNKRRRRRGQEQPTAQTYGYFQRRPIEEEAETSTLIYNN